MTTIYKYPVPNKPFEIELTEGARILTVQIQYGEPFLWVMLDPKNKPQTRKFIAIGTGYNIKEHPNSLEYINTFQFYNGRLIFHLFEIIDCQNQTFFEEEKQK